MALRATAGKIKEGASRPCLDNILHSKNLPSTFNNGFFLDFSLKTVKLAPIGFQPACHRIRL